jgi:hypothetical protein
MPLVMCDAMIVCPTWIAMTRDAISLLPTSGTGPDVFTQPRSVADRRRPIVTDGSDLKPAAQAAKDASAYRTATSVALVIEANGRLEKARPASLGRLPSADRDNSIASCKQKRPVRRTGAEIPPPRPGTPESCHPTFSARSQSPTYSRPTF